MTVPNTLAAPGIEVPAAEPPAEPAFHIGPHALRPLRPGMPVMALAPMAGVGNWVFRLICAQLGARLVGVEFINCRLVHQTGRRMERLLDFNDAEVYRRTGISLLAAQIYGNDIAMMAEGAAELERRGSQVVDINFGCSVPQIIRKGSCAAFLRDLPRFYEAVRATVDAVSVPVMVKTRIGWDDNSINIVEKYDGRANWDWIRRACDNADVPIFGNGDVRTYEDAVAMTEQTGCDGVMVGRAAMANPWIFSGRRGASLAQRIDLAAEQVRWMAQYKGERVGVQETRKHLVLYFRDLERGSVERQRLLTTASLGELLDFLEQWRESLQEDEERDLELSRSEADRLAWSGTD